MNIFFRLLFVLLSVCACLRVTADEGPEWHSAYSPNQRFLVRGTRPELVQGVSVWAARSHRLLERELGVEIPFARHVPLTIVLDPDAGETELEEVRTTGVPRQTLWTPAAEGLAVEDLADTFTRAMLSRVLAARQEDPRVAVRPPDWWVRGISHLLMEDATGVLTAEGLRLWRENRLPMPQVILGRPRAAGGDDLAQRAAEVLAVRWLMRSGISLEDLYQTLAAGETVPAAWWVAQLQGVNDLRGLHIHWELFLSERERTAMHEFRLEDLARQRFERLLRVRPAEYGLDGDFPRHRVFDLRELAEELEEAWVPTVLERWLVRAQPLRFRQSEAFIQTVDAYSAAVSLMLEAARREGRARDRLLAEAEQALAEAESRLRELGEGERF